MKRLTHSIADNLSYKFRSENGLSKGEAINIKSLLRKLNIITLFRPLSDTFYGMSLKSPSGVKFILINSNNAKGRQHFSIAHELYHLYVDENPVPHICQETDKKPVAESNADMFAAALLMPREGLLEFITNEEISNKTLSLGTVIKMEQYFSVSRQALLYRLKNCDIISAVTFNSLMQYPVKNTAKEYGYDTALYNAGNEGLMIGDFGEKARLLYERGDVSEGHYLELLNLINNGCD